MKRITFANVIANGGFDLTNILARIDESCLIGDLTDAEREELTSMARDKAKPHVDAMDEIPRLWAAIRELQKQFVTLYPGGEDSSEDAADEWPEYVQPTGAHDAYNTGDKITHNGARYVCQMDGCVWTPDVYPAGWKKWDGDAV